MDNNELDQNKLAEAIAWHLAYNFIPPQPPQLLEYCIEAVNACNNGKSNQVISLPAGGTVTAGDLVENLRINDMIEGKNE